MDETIVSSLAPAANPKRLTTGGDRRKNKVFRARKLQPLQPAQGMKGAEYGRGG